MNARRRASEIAALALKCGAELEAIALREVADDSVERLATDLRATADRFVYTVRCRYGQKVALKIGAEVERLWCGYMGRLVL